MADYDIIIVGGGHNGLACGCYLAKAGEKVLVLERRENIGGGACTEERTLPGFKHNLHSTMHGWIHGGPVYKDLELEKYGSRYVFPDPNYVMVFRDGRSLCLYKDVDRTCKEIEKFSRRDAKTYRETNKKFTHIKDMVMASWFSPPTAPSLAFSMLEGSEDGLEFLRIMQSSPQHVCEELFESDQVKTWILLMATQGGNPQDLYGTGAFIPLLLAGMHSDPYGLSVGGSRMLVEALAKALEAHGGKVCKNTHVKKIIVKDGAAIGVELLNGDKIMAKKAVVSNTSVTATLLDLVDEEHLDDAFIKKAKAFTPDEVTILTTHLALNEPPLYKAARDNPDVQKALTVGWGVETPDELQSQFIDIKSGIPTRQIGNLSFSPTVHDPSQAPPGKHTAFLWQFNPYNLKDGGPEKWDRIKEEYGNRVVEAWKEYAPNLTRDNILGSYIHSPLDVEREIISMFKGSMLHGHISSDQMGYFRPFPGWSQYRMPIKNLYLCGGSAHPTGGISGAPGHNAAGVIADDFGVKRWWEPVTIFQ